MRCQMRFHKVTFTLEQSLKPSGDKGPHKVFIFYGGHKVNCFCCKCALVFCYLFKDKRLKLLQR